MLRPGSAGEERESAFQISCPPGKGVDFGVLAIERDASIDMNGTDLAVLLTFGKLPISAKDA
jgi:hypothetical protein